MILQKNTARNGPYAALIVAHGTRDVRGQEEFRRLLTAVRENLPEAIVEGAFLELADPDIAAAVDALARRGATQVAVVPLLLFAAGHAKRDIPRAVAAAACRHSDIELRQTAHLGCQEAMLALSQQRFDEALAHATSRDLEETLLIMVGRGSHDDEAIAEFQDFARLRAQRSGVKSLETCFLAMRPPSLEETLAKASQSSFRRIVVQPHLLFCGELLDRVVRLTEDARRQFPRQDYLLTDRLGPALGLAQLVAATVRTASQPAEPSLPASRA